MRSESLTKFLLGSTGQSFSMATDVIVVAAAAVAATTVDGVVVCSSSAGGASRVVARSRDADAAAGRVTTTTAAADGANAAVEPMKEARRMAENFMVQEEMMKQNELFLLFVSKTQKKNWAKCWTIWTTVHAWSRFDAAGDGKDLRGRWSYGWLCGMDGWRARGCAGSCLSTAPNYVPIPILIYLPTRKIVQDPTYGVHHDVTCLWIFYHSSLSHRTSSPVKVKKYGR